MHDQTMEWGRYFDKRQNFEFGGGLSGLLSFLFLETNFRERERVDESENERESYFWNHSLDHTFFKNSIFNTEFWQNRKINPEMNFEKILFLINFDTPVKSTMLKILFII